MYKVYVKWSDGNYSVGWCESKNEVENYMELIDFTKARRVWTRRVWRKTFVIDWYDKRLFKI